MGADAEPTEADLTQDADGTLHLRWPRSAVIRVGDAERAMHRVNELCGESRHPMLVHMATTASVTPGARAVFSRRCQASRIALLGSSPVDRVIANFFLGINTLPCPTKFFTSERDAMAWLAIR